MKIIRYAIALIIITTALLPLQIAAADMVKIGVILPLTGHDARFGQIQQKAVLMAAGEINSGGGVNSKKIESIFADTKGQSDTGRAAINHPGQRRCDRWWLFEFGYLGSLFRRPAKQDAVCGKWRRGGQNHRAGLGIHLQAESAGE